MDGLAFVAAIVKATAWPAVVIATIAFFRKPLTLVIGSLRSLNFRDLEMRFENRLEDLEDVGAVVQPEAQLDSPGPRVLIGKNTSVSENPEKRIIRDWYLVRRAIWDLAKKSGMSSADRLKPMGSIKWLEQKEVIDPTVASLLRELRQLRRMVRSGQGVLNIDADQADRYRRLSAQMISTLEAINLRVGP